MIFHPRLDPGDIITCKNYSFTGRTIATRISSNQEGENDDGYALPQLAFSPDTAVKLQHHLSHRLVKPKRLAAEHAVTRVANR